MEENGPTSSFRSVNSRVIRERQESEENNELVYANLRTNKKLRLGLRIVIGVLLFALVLSCVVSSKLSVLEVAYKLRDITFNRKTAEREKDAKEIAQYYWQLVFILILPNTLTLVRCAVVGVIGKTTRVYPWPKISAIVMGIVTSILEVIAASTFVFSVLAYLPPELGLLCMQPVFVAQFMLDIFYTKCSCRHCTNIGYHNLDDQQHRPLNTLPNEEQPSTAESSFERLRSRLRHVSGTLLENKIMKTVALVLQIGGTTGLIVTVLIHMKRQNYQIHQYLVPVIGLPLSILTLSVLWSNKVQEFLSLPAKVNGSAILNNARYKANFLMSLYRILLYPLLAYAVFRVIHLQYGTNPWTGSPLELFGHLSNLPFFLTHILTSFFGYLFAWTACFMTLRTIGFALPLLLSTPVVLVVRATKWLDNSHTNEDWYSIYLVILWFAIYLGQVLGMGYFLCTKSNLILSQDKDMFLNPHYESVFLEQYLSLNRQVDKYSGNGQVTSDGQSSASRAIFICSTMYHESVREMRQMLKSIKKMSDWYAEQQRWRGSREYDFVESHIFFDGAVNGGQLTRYALQLLSLVNDCLGVSVTQCIRKETHYGQCMSWDIGLSSMKFTVHFKDNLKVKNKKRWSQVMYMNYVINHRIRESNLSKDDTFILTTDADIQFTAESAMVLLDTLASNREVGAVCARTHPKGSGILYWYQVFDYAIGHWFIKPAEHLFGCVLCCPGCFSVFRCSALEQVLVEYSSEVKGAADFLTKDMGEDRWLCTLLIEKGWRLEYCAISEDHTYCPESFDEFYKQRRRWVPSTLANLLLLISKAGKITSNNNSVSLPFVLFQAIIAFSTAISPATVILIIASGLQGSYEVSEGGVITAIVILSLISVLYGCVCLYTSQKTQIDLAKILTFLFAIVMTVVFVGIFKQIIFEIFPVDNGLLPLHPPICRNESDTNCKIAQNNLGVLVNTSSPFKSVRLPTSPIAWYVGMFAVTYTLAAILHLWEATALFHSLWYMLGLPSGYLLLLIYSAVNLNSTSWGTRETTSNKKSGGGFQMVKKWMRVGTKTMMSLCCGRNKANAEQMVPILRAGDEETEDEKVETYNPVGVQHKEMREDAKKWLRKQECFEYADRFVEHGYWNMSYIASMKREQFRAIGIDKKGLVLRLEKAAKNIPSKVIDNDIPATVTNWLVSLEMEEYTELFHNAGYKTEADVENLKEIDDKELKKMGITKMAHVQRLKKALDSLFHPTSDEIQMHRVKRALSTLPAVPHRDTEDEFWQRVASNELKPVSVHLQQSSKEIEQQLKTLRNSSLVVIFMVNVIWILLLYTVTLPQLEKYHLPKETFTFLFLVVYGFIIIVSFIAMLVHRFLMLVQFLGRPEVVHDAARGQNPEELILVDETDL